MELRQLTTFVRVAQFQSFSKAAASLGYSQSAVTVQIRLLEQELGVRLFDRMCKRVILTGQGRQFLESAYTILQDVNRASLALAQDSGALTGQLHIGTLESLCFARLPGVIHTFRTKHPAVNLQITTGIPKELIRKMEQGEVDIIYILDVRRTDLQQQLAQVDGTARGNCHGGICLIGKYTSAGPLPLRRSVGTALLLNGARRKLPPHAGPPFGRFRALCYTRFGKQLCVVSGSCAGKHPGAFLFAALFS